MAITSLLDIPIKNLIDRLERMTGISLPRKVISISLNQKVLHIRFAYPKTMETEVEPLPLKSLINLFRDKKTGEITAIEIIDIEDTLTEIQNHQSKKYIT